MDSRARLIASVAAGIAVYLALVLLLYAIGRIALPRSGGLYPLWYTGAELLLKSFTAVAPGFVAGWICRTKGIGPGAIVGGIGGAIEIILIAALTGAPFDAYAKRIAVNIVFTGIGSALTNAAGGSAGRSLRARLRPYKESAAPATGSLLPVPVAAPSRRRRRRKLYAS